MTTSNEDYSLGRPFTHKGHWWIPSAQHSVAGNLCCGEEDLTLSLYGALETPEARPQSKRQPFTSKLEIIHGETVQGEYVTLLRSFYLQRQLPFGFNSQRPDAPPHFGSCELNTEMCLSGLTPPVPNRLLLSVSLNCHSSKGGLETYRLLFDRRMGLTLRRSSMFDRNHASSQCQRADVQFTSLRA